MARTCARCGTPLPGRRGHGWPTRDGQAVVCNGDTHRLSEKGRLRKVRRHGNS